MFISLACLFLLSSDPRCPMSVGPCFALHPALGEMKALYNLPRLLKLLKGPNYPEIRAGKRAVSRELESRGRHFIPADVSGIQAEVSVSPFIRPHSARTEVLSPVLGVDHCNHGNQASTLLFPLEHTRAECL